ncbi:MAG: acyltransferase family protein [Aminipila sp.]
MVYKMTKRIELYDRVRVYATILVVIGHFTSMLVYGADNGIIVGEEFLVDKLWVFEGLEILRKFIYMFHMPLFAMLSGAVFEHSGSKISKDYFVNKMTHLLLPYLFVASFILFPFRLIIGYYGDEISIPNAFIVDILLGHDVNYLWYLPMLFSLSILFSVFRRWNIKYIVIYAIILVGLWAISPQLYYLPFSLGRSVEFALWFWIGILFENHRGRIVARRSIGFIILCICGALISFIAFSYLDKSSINGSLNLSLWTAKKVFHLLCATFGALAIILLCDSKRTATSKIFGIIRSYSFGIYLFHVPIGYIVRKTIVSIVSPSLVENSAYFALIALTTICSLSISVIISWMLRKLHIKI